MKGSHQFLDSLNFKASQNNPPPTYHLPLLLLLPILPLYSDIRTFYPPSHLSTTSFSPPETPMTQHPKPQNPHTPPLLPSKHLISPFSTQLPLFHNPPFPFKPPSRKPGHNAHHFLPGIPLGMIGLPPTATSI